ncbi:MAG: hypothetical protein IK079_02525 [Desulfovibrio sp.]|nr:hypothetical protein [Desulfovibrio sp.]
MCDSVVLLISKEAESLSESLTPILEADFSIQIVENLRAAEPFLDPKSPPAVVVVDARKLEAEAIRPIIIQILNKCALTQVTVISKIEGEEFHETMEGLGMLPPLPEEPTKADVQALVEKVQRLMGTHYTSH